MMNFIHPDCGNISICNMDSKRQAKEIKSIVGYMPGDCTFYDNVKGIDILRFCAQMYSSSLEQMLELATYFEMDIQKKPSELSLGNKKKLSIIQAFGEGKEILILDEPTSGLDPFMQKRFFELLVKYREEGRTIFLSSHNLSDLEKYCDRVLIIKDGKIVEDIDMNKRREKQSHVVHYVTKSGEEKTFSFDGELDNLIHQLSELALLSLEIRPATVEDEFIRYFGGK